MGRVCFDPHAPTSGCHPDSPLVPDPTRDHFPEGIAVTSVRYWLYEVLVGFDAGSEVRMPLLPGGRQVRLLGVMGRRAFASGRPTRRAPLDSGQSHAHTESQLLTTTTQNP